MGQFQFSRVGVDLTRPAPLVPFQSAALAIDWPKLARASGTRVICIVRAHWIGPDLWAPPLSAGRAKLWALLLSMV